MPAGRQEKQYVVKVTAAARSLRAAPADDNRAWLFIQNTGANSGLVRLNGDVRGDGGDILFAAGQGILWDQPGNVPKGSLNFFSTGGTTFCVIEG